MANYYYNSAGSGKAILLLHGFGEDKSLWDPLFKKWDGSANLIALDLPGFGEAAPFRKAPQIEDYANYVLEFLQEQKIREAVILGHSMGGYIALEMASIKPSCVTALGLINSHPFGDTEIKKEFRRRAIRLIKLGGSGLYIRELYKTMFPKEFSAANKELVETRIKIARQYPPAGLLHALNAMMNREDRSAILKKAKYPVWFVAGKNDAIIPFNDSLRMFAFPDICKIVAVPGMGHTAPLENPALFHQELKKFLEMVPDKQKTKSGVSKKQLVKSL